jgi:hypothetical protein
MLSAHGPRVAARIATNPTATNHLLRDLAAHRPPVHKVFRKIAAHPHADADTLLHCLHDIQARPIAARHPALPSSAVVDLLTDADERVAEAAAANPALPQATMRELINRLVHHPTP